MTHAVLFIVEWEVRCGYYLFIEMRRNVEEQKKILGQFGGWSGEVTCMFSTYDCFEHILLKNKTCTFMLGVDGSCKKVHLYRWWGL
jgi:hypothetical protein